MSAAVAMPALTRWASAPAAVEQPPTAACAVCMDSVELAELVSLCGRACETLMCAACTGGYLNERAGGDKAFACCPRVVCPGAGCRKFVPFEAWHAHAPEEVAKNYRKNAGMLLSVRCQACDDTRTVLPEFDEAAVAPASVAAAAGPGLARHMAGDSEGARLVVDAVEAFVESGEALKGLRDELAELERRHAEARTIWRKWMGERGGAAHEVNRAATAARKRFGRAKAAMKEDPESKEAEAELEEARAQKNELAARRKAMMEEQREKLGTHAIAAQLNKVRKVLADDNTREDTMKLVLASVRDEERRAALMLHYLSRFPVVSTVCHGRRTCFKCKVAGGHPGTCREYQDKNLCNQVRRCPNCSVPFVRGDGCSSMTCPVCSQYFSWGSAELVAQE